MRFRLVEYQDFPNADDAQKKAENEYKQDIRSAKSPEDKDEALKKLLSKWANDKKISKNLIDGSFKDIRKVILKSIDEYGASESGNKFLKYVIENSDVLKAEDAAKVDILQGLMNKGLIEYGKGNKWFSDRTLYDRPDDEFEYTVKIFDIANNEDTAKRWFKDIYYTDDRGKEHKISPTDLYFNGKIKESGLHDHDDPKKQTIWNQVETWAKKLGEVESDTDTKNRKFSLNDLFRQKFGLTDNTEEKINTLINILKKEKVTPNIDLFEREINSLDASRVESIFDDKKFTSFSNNAISEYITKEFDL